MSAPWEKYQSADAGAGPWAKYQAVQPHVQEQPDSTLNNVASTITKGMQFINNPGGQDMSHANTMEPQGNNMFAKAGGNVAEYLGGKNLPGNPYTAAAVGTGVSMLNPQNWITPAVEGPTTAQFLKPVVPAERQAAVSAAQEAGVPLSRAEQTGGRFMAGTENFLEKTPLGSGPMQDARTQSDAAMQAYKERLQSQMGTPKENFDVGYQAKPAMSARDVAMNQKRSEMFNAIPENVHIPLDEARNTADQIIQEQSQYLPTTRNGDVLAIAQDVQKAHEGVSSGGTPTGVETQGITYTTPDKTIKPTSVSRTSSLLDESGKPLNYQENISGKTIKGTTEYGTQASASPGSAGEPKANYQLLKRLRETLGGKAQDARSSGNFAAERDFLRLKSSIDADINNYVKNQNTPLGSMIGKEFADTYSRANAFSGAYKNLFKSDAANVVTDAPPEKILGMVFQKNNETAIKQFRALVGEDAFQQAKRKWVNDLLESPNVSQALSEKKIDPGTLNAVLSPPEQQALTKYGSVQGIRKTVGSLQGTQGSARTATHALSYGAGLDALGAFMRRNHAEAAAAGSAFLGPYPLAKLITSKAVREGISVSIPESVRQAAMASFIDRVTTKDNP